MNFKSEKEMMEALINGISISTTGLAKDHNYFVLNSEGRLVDRNKIESGVSTRSYGEFYIYIKPINFISSEKMMEFLLTKRKIQHVSSKRILFLNLVGDIVEDASGNCEFSISSSDHKNWMPYRCHE